LRLISLRNDGKFDPNPLSGVRCQSRLMFDVRAGTRVEHWAVNVTFHTDSCKYSHESVWIVTTASPAGSAGVIGEFGSDGRARGTRPTMSYCLYRLRRNRFCES